MILDSHKVLMYTGINRPTSINRNEGMSSLRLDCWGNQILYLPIC